MKQLLQSASDGSTQVADVPAPEVRPGFVLVRTGASLVSAGTERTAVDFSRKSLLDKARARPDLVKKVLDKARTEGPLTAWRAAKAKLDQPLVLGYSSAGVVLEVGEGVEGFRAGDRVVCAGGGYASHAEVVCVPRNLIAPLPDGVPWEHACFGTVGAIGLHGLRVAEVQIGERIAVIGLGLIGLMTVQMAKAAGARVLGVDLDASRVKLALELGADVAVTLGEGDPEEAVRAFTGGAGVDAALITAGTKSNEPVALAGAVCRDRGRVVVVGAVGMDLPRPPYYDKELSFRVSRSYGPGRYDPTYEEGGVDYPLGYVRWTENRNLAQFVELVADGKVRLDRLVTHRIPIEDGVEAYRVLSSGDAGALGIVLTYGDPTAAHVPARRVDLSAAAGPSVRGSGREPGVGVLGAGNFALATMLPAMKAAGGLRLTCVATARGASALHAARTHGFASAASSVDEVLRDPATDVVAILTRHDLHAAQIRAALGAGKHVFVEKPPCLDEAELADVVRALDAAGPGRLLTVGYNRRFAPLVTRLRAHVEGVGEPLSVQIRVNAGFIPPEHWVHDPAVGGGRIIGEVCHFVDLAAYLTGSLPERVVARAVPDRGRYREDNVALTLVMADGSVVSILYTASGDRASGKERFEVFGGGRTGILDDFRTLDLFGGGRRKAETSRLGQDKGHRGEWEVLAARLRDGGEPPIPTASWVATSLATFAAVRSLRSGTEEAVDAAAFLASVRAAAGGAA